MVFSICRLPRLFFSPKIALRQFLLDILIAAWQL